MGLNLFIGDLAVSLVQTPGGWFETGSNIDLIPRHACAGPFWGFAISCRLLDGVFWFEFWIGSLLRMWWRRHHILIRNNKLTAESKWRCWRQIFRRSFDEKAVLRND